MDFATFKADTLEHLWRTGDAELDAQFARLTRSAESRIRTDLKLRQTDVVETISATSESFTLPAACDIPRNVNFVGMGPGTYVTENAFDEYERHTAGGYPITVRVARANNLVEYTIKGRTLYHRALASVEAPQDVELTYTPLPASIVDGDLTLYNQYQALLEQAVYMNCYDFLRDSEGLVQATSAYTVILDRTITDQNYKKFGDGPLKMNMPRSDVS